ncbi:MFS general substrate transporter [Coniochaeta ligniaria NRRL 30616]|uniref:MFS general substrate transporter n=1 Tax=Coniochaeta ligniaria NRRL 30616 TaxID=1408157 RepID=A0A1J7IVW1_9PEZI|nr:MFS general substrate transporter [Coniochaeta ligniaria NRRL 30616]
MADLSEKVHELPALTEARVEASTEGSSTSSARRQPHHDGPDASVPKLESEQSQDVRKIRGLRWLGVCIALYVGTFLYGLDTTIAADVQGPVVERFGHVEQLAWIGGGFPLGSICVILPFGAIYTSFNMKWLFVTAVILFEAGSALCGAAPSMNAMIVGRVIAGAGGAGIYLGGLTFFTALTTMEERGRYISGTGFCWGIGAVLGPVIGGAFSVSSATWRWAFYINLVVGAITAPLFLFALPDVHPIIGVPIKTRIANLDGLGFLLNAGIWVSFTMAITMAGGQWPWDDGRTISTWVVFGVLVVLYSLQQYYCILTTPETRSYPVQLLRKRTQVVLYIATSANITTMFVVIYFIPIYFQFVHGDSAIMAAVRLLPFVAITVSTNLASGHFLPRLQYYMVMYIVSGLLMTLGGGLLWGFLEPDANSANIYGFTVIIAFGTGITINIGYTIASLKVDRKDEGDAISFQNVSQLGSTLLSLVIAGQIFQSGAVRNLKHALEGQGFSDADIQAAVAGTQSIIFEKISGPLREAAVWAITDAMRDSFIMVIVAGAVITVCGTALRFERLFKDPNRPVNAA